MIPDGGMKLMKEAKPSDFGRNSCHQAMSRWNSGVRDVSTSLRLEVIENSEIGRRMKRLLLTGMQFAAN